MASFFPIPLYPQESRCTREAFILILRKALHGNGRAGTTLATSLAKIFGGLLQRTTSRVHAQGQALEDMRTGAYDAMADLDEICRSLGERGLPEVGAVRRVQALLHSRICSVERSLQLTSTGEI